MSEQWNQYLAQSREEYSRGRAVWAQGGRCVHQAHSHSCANRGRHRFPLPRARLLPQWQLPSWRWHHHQRASDRPPSNLERCRHKRDKLHRVWCLHQDDHTPLPPRLPCRLWELQHVWYALQDLWYQSKYLYVVIRHVRCGWFSWYLRHRRVQCSYALHSSLQRRVHGGIFHRNASHWWSKRF